MRRITIILLLLVTFLSGCKNDKDPAPEYDQIDIVTGIYLRNELAQLWNSHGNPNSNILVNNIAKDDNEGQGLVVEGINRIVMYPNPCSSIIYIHSPIELSKVWIIPAKPISAFQSVNFENKFNESSYDENKIDQVATKNIKVEANEFVVNISDLEQGFYRIFVKDKNGGLKWDNIFVDRGIENWESYLENIWN